MVTLWISGGEIFVILIIVVLLFGPKKIPEIARGLGKGMNEFRKATDEIKREINGTSNIAKDINEVKRTVEKDIEEGLKG